MDILKTDKKRQMVFGWANVSKSADGSMIVDSDNETVEIGALEDAAYEFVLYEGTANEQHQGGVCGVLVESFVVTEEKLGAMGLATGAVQKGWWLGFYIPNPEVFAKVEKGEYAMFSIEGTAVPVPLA